MVAVVSGSGLGLFNSSASSLGGAGSNGNPVVGRGRDRVYVNSSTGNLIVQSVDETLAALGLDFAGIRTYNSQGFVDEDNNDQWRLGVQQRIYKLTGTVGMSGSTVTKVFGDGAEILYTWNQTRLRYESGDGDGANDYLTWNVGNSRWTWTDGSSRAQEEYGQIDGVQRIRLSRDADGNTVNYNYDDPVNLKLLTSITMVNPTGLPANAQTVTFTYTGTNLTGIVVSSGGAVQTLTRYGYDTSNRLQTVTVDLTPADNAVADNVTYTTTYAYEGTSKRISSISQKDGSSVGFQYQQLNGEYRLWTVTDAENRVTTFTYSNASGGGGTQATATATAGQISNQDTSNVPYSINLNTLVRGEQQTTYTPYGLNTGQLTTPGGASWGTAAALEAEPSGSTASSPQVAFDSNGNGFAIWTVLTGGSYTLKAAQYTRSTNSWAAPVSLHTSTSMSPQASLAVDAGGNAIVAWMTGQMIQVARYTGSWGAATTVISSGASFAPKVAISGTRAALIWAEGSGLSRSAYVSRWNGSTWSAKATVDNQSAAVNELGVAADDLGNVIVSFTQVMNGESVSCVWTNQYRVSTGAWTGAVTRDPLAPLAASPQLAMDANGNAFFAFFQDNEAQVMRYTRSTNSWSAAEVVDTLTGAVSQMSLAVDPSGNAVLSWIQVGGGANSVYAKVYNATTSTWGSVATLESLTTAATAGSLRTSVRGSFATAVWLQNDGTRENTYAATFNGTSWSAATVIESSTQTPTAPAIAIDSLGNASAIWIQSNGTSPSVYTNRFAAGAGGARYYLVPASATWQSIANTLYGVNSAAAGTALQNAMPVGTSIAAGSQLLETNLPSPLQVPLVSTVPDYYLIPGTPATPTWRSIAAVVYGIDSAAAGTVLQNIMQATYPTLSVGLKIMGLPSSITVPTTVTLPYYYHVVQSSDWATTMQTIYGFSDPGLIEAVKAYSGVQTPTLTVGTRLQVQPSQLYTVGGGAVTAAVYLTTSVQNSLNIPTTYTQDTQGRVTSMLVAGIETRFAYDSETGNVNKITEDPTGLNRITDFVYDSITGVLRFSRDSLGNTVQRTYNTNNQLLTEVRYTSPDPDAINSGSTPAGAMTTRYAYDAENHLRFEISADGRVTEHQYNTAGQRILSFNYLAAAYPGASAFTETDLQNWTAAAGAGVRERVDYAYDWRGNLLTLTRWEKTTPAGAGTGTSSITQFVYDQRGQLLQTIDPRGSATAPNATNPDQNQAYSRTYVYDGLGRVKTAVEWLKPADADGPLRTRTTLTTYDDASRSTTVLLDNGLSTISTFNRAGELVGTNNGALGTANYFYDAMGRLRIVKDPTGVRQFSFYDDANRLIGKVDGDGTVTEFIYDKASQVIKTVRYSVLLSASRITSLFDSGTGNPTSVAFSTLRTEAGTNTNADQVSRNVYDNAGRLVYMIETIGIDPTLLTPIDAVTKFVYDGANRLLEEVRYKTTISIARSTDQVLPSAIVTSDNAEDRRTRHFYDNSGNRVATLDGAGYLSEFTYDNAGHLITKFERANFVAVGLRATGTLTQLQTSAGLDPAPPTAPTDTDPDFDIATYYYYDMQGRLSAVLDGAGYYTKTNYDVAGNAISTVRYKEPLTYTSRPLQSTIETDLGAMASHTQAREFDGAGRLVREINYQGTATKYEYDGVDNVLSVRAAQGDAADERWTATRYDFLGRVTQELTAEGKALIVGLGASPAPAAVEDIWTRYGILYQYDNGGRRKSATAKPNDTQTNVTLYFYDNDSRLRFEINQLGERTEYKYNGLGQLTDKIKYFNRISTSGYSGGLLSSLTQTQQDFLVSSPDSTRDAKTSFTYSLRGQQLSSLTIEGAKVTQTYNTFGEADTRTVGVGTEAVGYGYTYTTRGQLKDTTRGGVGVETREYDAFGRLTKLTDGRGKISKSEYDRIGRVIATVDAVGGRSTISYDGYSRVKETFDATSTINKTSFTYDDTQLTTTMLTPEGVSVVTKETRHGETRSVTVSSSQDGVVSNKVYTYTKNGQLETVTDGGTLVETNAYDRGGRLTDLTDARGIRTTIAYDAANRVFTRTVDTPSTQWPTGNLLLKTTYAYDGEGRVTDVTDANNVVTHTTYDRDGRVKEVAVDPAGLNLRTAYDYNTRNDTITVTEMSGTLLPRRTQYLFDTAGRRKEEIVDPTSLGGTLNLRTQYKYDGADNVTRKIDSRGNSTWYVYDDKNRLTHTIDALGGMTYVTYDAVDRVASTRRYAAPISPADLAGLASNDAPTASNFAMPAQGASDRYERTFYDKDGREKYSIDGLGVVTERLFDAAGNVKRLRVISTVRMTLAYTDADHLFTQMGSAATTIDPADHVTWNAFDARGRVEFSISAIDGSVGSVRRFTYDGNGNVISTRAFATSRALTLATDLTTLSNWATSNASAANDQVTRFWYDTADRQRFVLDAENGLVQSIYNDLNRTTTSIAYKNVQAAVAALAATSTAQNVAGQISANALEDRTTISWADTAGRARLVLNAEGYLTQTSYNDNTGSISSTVYALTPSTTPNASTALATAAGYARTSASDRTTQTWFDAAGRERFTRDGEGYATETRYLDSSSQVLNVVYYRKPAINATDTLALVETAAANAPDQSSNQITTTTLDAAGRTKQIKDADNKTEYFVYDAVGNKTKYVNKKATGITDANYTWNYEYDANSNLTFERSPSVVVTTVDPVTMIPSEATVPVVTHNEYDAFGNVKKRTEAENVSGQARVISYEYDRLNRQTATVSPTVGVYNSTLGDGEWGNGAAVQRRETQTQVRTETSYDVFGNAFRNRVVTAGAPATDGTFTYKAYDRLGRVKYDIDAKDQVTGYVYDAFGNKTDVTRYVNPHGSTSAWKTATSLLLSQVSVSANSAVDRTLTTKYDRLGRATEVKQPSIRAFAPTSTGAAGSYYNAQPKTEYVYNAFGDVIRTSVQINTGEVAHTYSYYDKLGRKTAELDPTRYLTEFEYDETGDLTRQVEYARPTTDAFDYSTFGTRAYTTQSDFAVGTTESFAGYDRETTFTYNKLNQKTSEVKRRLEYGSIGTDDALTPRFDGVQTTSFGYDVLGNLTRITDELGTSYSFYDVLGRVVATAGPARNLGLSTSKFSFTRMDRDANGNLVRSIEYFNGLASDAFGTTLPLPDAPALPTSPAAHTEDRTTLMVVDNRGKITRTRDAFGADHYASYNARGDVAKEWQVVFNAMGAGTTDDVTETIVKLYRYDAVGQTTGVVESQRYNGSNTDSVTRVADYNAFGEIIYKYNQGTADAEKQYFEYDQAGNVWRTTGEDGVDKVFMYDLAGNATLELRSSGSDVSGIDLSAGRTTSSPGTYTSAQNVIDTVAAANLLRTETVYDVYGNVTQRRLPSYDVDTRYRPVATDIAINTFGGIPYVFWTPPSANPGQTTFWYRLPGGSYTQLTIESLAGGKVGVNVNGLNDQPYEFRLVANFSADEAAVASAESLGTFRVDRATVTNYSSITVTPLDTSLDVQPIAIQQSGPINLTATPVQSEGWLGTYWYPDNALNCDIRALGNIPVRVFVQYSNWDRSTPTVPHGTTRFWDLATAADVTQLRWQAAAGDQYGGLMYDKPITVTIMGLTAVGGTTTGTIAQTNAPAGPPMLIWNAPADISVTAVFKYKRVLVDPSYSSVNVSRFGGGQFRLDVANLLTSGSDYDYEIEYWKDGAVVSRRGGQMNSTGVSTSRSPNGTLSDAALDAWAQNIPTPAVGANYTLQWAAPPSTWGAVTATFGVRENSTGAFVARTINTGSMYSVSLADLPKQNTPYEYQIVYTLGGRTIAEQRGIVNLQYTASSTTTDVTGVSTDTAPADIAPVSTVSGRSGVGSATGSRFGGTPIWSTLTNSWMPWNQADVSFPPVPASQAQFIRITVYFTFAGGGSTVGLYETGVLSTTTAANVPNSITWTPGTTTSTARITWNPGSSSSGRAIVAVTNVVVNIVDAAGGNRVLARSMTAGTGTLGPPVLQWAAPTQSGLTTQFYVNGSLRSITPSGGTLLGDVTGYTGTNNYEIRYLRSNDPQAIVSASGQFTNDGVSTTIVPGSQTAINRNPSWISVGRSGNTVTWSRVADQGSNIKFEYSTDQVNYTSIPVVASGDNINFWASVQGFATRRYYYRITYAGAPSGVLPYVKSEGYFDVTTNTVTETTVLDRQNPHFNQQYGPNRISPVTLPANSDVVSWTYQKTNASDTVKFFYTVGATEYMVDLSANIGPSYSAAMSALPIAANQAVTWRIEYRTGGAYQYAMANGAATITVNGTQVNPVVTVTNQALRSPSGVQQLPAPTDLGGGYFGWASLSPGSATVKFYLNDAETPIETVGSTRRINLASLTGGTSYKYEITFTDGGAITWRVKGTFTVAKTPGGVTGMSVGGAAARVETAMSLVPTIGMTNVVYPPQATYHMATQTATTGLVPVYGARAWGPESQVGSGGIFVHEWDSPITPAFWSQVAQGSYFFGSRLAISIPITLSFGVDLSVEFWLLSDPATVKSASVSNPDGTMWVADIQGASGIANGNYGYRIKLTRQGAQAPVGMQEGTFVVGSTNSITVSPAATPAPVVATPTTAQSFDRWGNLIKSTDASLNVTEYRYNGRNQLVQTLEAFDWIYDKRDIAGDKATKGIYTRAEKTNSYDLWGRIIETQDGYDQAIRVSYNNAGQQLTKRNADYARYGTGATSSNVYDIFGNLRQSTDALGYRTRYKYDRLGRLTEVWREIDFNVFTSPSDVTNTTPTNTALMQSQFFKYDEAGRRIAETNGENETVRYRYDFLGNVTLKRTNLGYNTSYVYNADGKKTSETDALGSTASWAYNAYGQLISHTEFSNVPSTGAGIGGGTVISYTYTKAGQLASQTGGGQNVRYDFDRGGNLATITDSAVNRLTSYRYDTAGRQARETVVVDGRLHQDTRITYDNHNRIKGLDDPDYRENILFDVNGNRAYVTASYHEMEQRKLDEVYRYTYDEMNRITQAITYLGDAQQNLTTDYAYNGRGDRVLQVAPGTAWSPRGSYYTQGSIGTSRIDEEYKYDGLGRLLTVKRNLFHTTSGTQNPTNIPLRTYTYDLANRQKTEQVSSVESATAFVTRYTTNYYDGDGRTTSQTTTKSTDGATAKNDTSVSYGTGRATYDSLSGTWGLGFDDANNLRGYQVQYFDNGSATYKTTFKSDYYLFDGYVERIQTANSEGSGKPDPGETQRYYNANHELIKFTDREAEKNRYFVSNQGGQILTGLLTNSAVTDVDSVWNSAMLHGKVAQLGNQYAMGGGQHFFYVQGNKVGSRGEAMAAGQRYQAHFDVNSTPISESYPTSTPATVIVQAGDTARTVAQRVFGDGSLWYIIAEENGITDPDLDLQDGMQLRIPNDVVSLSNTSNSFKPYNISDVLGDTTPTQPPPPAPKDCGLLGQFIMAVVAMIVMCFVPYLAPFLSVLGPFAGMAAAAIGSAATQGIGIALKIQDKFDWNAVGIAALSAGVLDGLGAAAEAAEAAKTAAAVANGAQKASMLARVGSFIGKFGEVGKAIAANVLTQGIAVATKMQSSFNWRSVAGAAVAAEIGKVDPGISEALAGRVGNRLANLAEDFVSNVGTSMAQAAFGGKTEMASIFVDAFGNALGNSIGTDLVNFVNTKAAERLTPQITRRPMREITPIGKDEIAKMPDTILADLNASIGIPDFDTSSEESSSNAEAKGKDEEALSEVVVAGRNEPVRAHFGRFTVFPKSRVDEMTAQLDSAERAGDTAEIARLTKLFSDNVGVSSMEGYRPTLDQYAAEERGDYIAYWKSVYDQSHGKQGRTELIGWGLGDYVGAAWWERAAAAIAWKSLSLAVKVHNMWEDDNLTMEQLGREFMSENLQARLDDNENTPNLLNRVQTAQYHHRVLERHGIRDNNFGGTIVSGSLAEAEVYGNMWDEYADVDTHKLLSLADDYFDNDGPAERFFGIGSRFSKSFSQSPAAEAFQNFFYDKYKGNITADSFVYNFDYEFTWTGTALKNLASPTAQQMGSYQNGFAVVKGDTVYFRVVNTAGLHSLTFGKQLDQRGYKSIPDIPSKNGVRSLLSNIDATVEWAVKIKDLKPPGR